MLQAPPIGKGAMLQAPPIGLMLGQAQPKVFRLRLKWLRSIYFNFWQISYGVEQKSGLWALCFPDPGNKETSPPLCSISVGLSSHPPLPCFREVSCYREMISGGRKRFFQKSRQKFLCLGLYVCFSLYKSLELIQDKGLGLFWFTGTNGFFPYWWGLAQVEE